MWRKGLREEVWSMLKSCGGVKGRCMTKGSIPAGLVKIMQPEIKAMNVKRAKELGSQRFV